MKSTLNGQRALRGVRARFTDNVHRPGYRRTNTVPAPELFPAGAQCSLTVSKGVMKRNWSGMNDLVVFFCLAGTKLICQAICSIVFFIHQNKIVFIRARSLSNA